MAGGGAIPTPWDYWHVSNASYSSDVANPQLSQYAAAVTAASPGVNTVRATPFWVGRRGRTVAQIGFNVTTSSPGAIVKLGIYDVDPPGSLSVYPKRLLASVQFTLAAGTGVQVGTFATPVDLPNGLFWIASAAGSGTGWTQRGAAVRSSQMGRPPLQWSTTTQNTLLTVALAAANPLPATFAAGATLAGTINPVFVLR